MASSINFWIALTGLGFIQCQVAPRCDAFTPLVLYTTTSDSFVCPESKERVSLSISSSKLPTNVVHTVDILEAVRAIEGRPECYRFEFAVLLDSWKINSIRMVIFCNNRELISTMQSVDGNETFRFPNGTETTLNWECSPFGRWNDFKVNNQRPRFERNDLSGEFVEFRQASPMDRDFDGCNCTELDPFVREMWQCLVQYAGPVLPKVNRF